MDVVKRDGKPMSGVRGRARKTGTALAAPLLAVQLAGALMSSSACSRAAPGSAARSLTTSPPAEQQMQQSTWTGSFHLLWGDPAPPRPGSPRIRYQLLTDGGEVVNLLVADSLLAEFGGPRGLTGKRVTLVGEPAKQGTGNVRVRSILLDPVRP